MLPSALTIFSRLLAAFLQYGTVVVEEIHDGEIAIGISGHRRVGIAQDHVAGDFVVVGARQCRE